jgi:hypothetical protein
MRSYLNFVSGFSILTLLASCSPPTQSAADRQAIEEVFSQYQTTITNHDGKSAVEFVSPDSLRMFDKLRESALHDDQDELNAWNDTVALLVLYLRHRFTAADLNSMDGKATLAAIIDDGMLDAESFQSTQLGKMVFQRQHDIPRGYSNAYINGSPSKVRLTFYQFDDGWKFGLDDYLSGRNVTIDLAKATAQWGVELEQLQPLDPNAAPATGGTNE